MVQGAAREVDPPAAVFHRQRFARLGQGVEPADALGLQLDVTLPIPGELPIDIVDDPLMADRPHIGVAGKRFADARRGRPGRGKQQGAKCRQGQRGPSAAGQKEYNDILPSRHG